MMGNTCQVILLFLMTCIYVNFNLAKDFGAFDLRLRDFAGCKGPKKKNCVIDSGKVTDQIFLDYDLNIIESMKISKGKILVLSNGKEIMRLQVKNPCQHLFLKPLFQKLFNATSDCLLLKGHYHMLIDIQEIARTYYGGDFLYGNWTFKSTFYNDDCNFSCSLVKVSMVPRVKDKK